METLYKRSKSGKLQQFIITHHNDTYTATWGYVDGKQQSKTTIAHPTNVGRSNERTAEQQAKFEAEALFQKKLKSGYTTNPDEQSTRHQAMKISKWPPKKIEYPLYVSNKYNGINATFKRINDTLHLLSRTGEEYPMIPHLVEPIISAMDKLNSNELVGELYIYKEHLQTIQSAVKKPNDNSKYLLFMLFDIGDSFLESFETRWNRIRSGLRDTDVIVIRNSLVHNESELIDKYNRAISLGLEGIVIKHPKALYEHGTRSNLMWKLKPVQSMEVRILSYTTDKNSHPVFTVETPNHIQFKVKPKGTDAERKQIITDFNSKYKNNWGTIEYETTSLNGTPLKPVFIALRKCNDKGEPLE